MLSGKSAVSHPIKEAGGTFRIWASFAIRSWRSILMFPLSHRCTVALLTFISSAICKRVNPSSFLLFFNTVDRFSTNSTPFVHLTIPRAFLKCKRKLAVYLLWLRKFGTCKFLPKVWVEIERGLQLLDKKRAI